MPKGWTPLSLDLPSTGRMTTKIYSAGKTHGGCFLNVFCWALHSAHSLKNMRLSGLQVTLSGIVPYKFPAHSPHLPDTLSVVSFSYLVLPIQIIPTLFEFYPLSEAIFYYSGIPLIRMPLPCTL